MREDEPTETPEAMGRQLWSNVRSGYVVLVAIIAIWSLVSHFAANPAVALIVDFFFLLMCIVWGMTVARMAGLVRPRRAMRYVFMVVLGGSIITLRVISLALWERVA